MIAAFLIGAGVGLGAGAGLGAIIMGLLAKARVEAAAASEMQASRLAVEAIERADRYLAELDAAAARCGESAPTLLADRPGAPVCALPARHAGWHRAEDGMEWGAAGPAGLDALVDATKPQVFDAEESWAEMGWRTAAEPPRPTFDPTPTVLLAPGQTYEQWYAAYAERLDSWAPGWWDDLPKTVAPELARLAEERRAETYEQNELDHDRVPTREGFEVRTDSQTGLLVNDATARHPATCAVHIGGRCNCGAVDTERPWRPNRPGIAQYPKESK